jgi:hypothetical protein
VRRTPDPQEQKIELNQSPHIICSCGLLLRFLLQNKGPAFKFERPKLDGRCAWQAHYDRWPRYTEAANTFGLFEISNQGFGDGLVALRDTRFRVNDYIPPQ